MSFSGLDYQVVEVDFFSGEVLSRIYGSTSKSSVCGGFGVQFSDFIWMVELCVVESGVHCG